MTSQNQYHIIGEISLNNTFEAESDNEKSSMLAIKSVVTRRGKNSAINMDIALSNPMSSSLPSSNDSTVLTISKNDGEDMVGEITTSQPLTPTALLEYLVNNEKVKFIM